jgi:hypothetical protein
MGLQAENTRSGLSSPGSIVGFEACSPKSPAAASATRSTSGVRPPRAPLGPSLCRELPMKTHRVDIHQHITDKIVSAIERGGEFRLPWYRSTGLRRTLPLFIARVRAPMSARSTARAKLSSPDVFSIQRSTAALVVILLRPTLRPGSSFCKQVVDGIRRHGEQSGGSLRVKHLCRSRRRLAGAALWFGFSRHEYLHVRTEGGGI